MPLGVRSVLVSALVLMPVVCTAEIRNFVISADGKTCSEIGSDTSKDPGKLIISVVHVGDPGQLGAWTVTYLRATDRTSQSALLEREQNRARASLEARDIAPGSTITLKGQANSNEVFCQTGPFVATGVDNTDLDGAATVWLKEQSGRDALARLKASSRADALLIHLPSGRLAATNPGSLRESDTQQIAVVIDKKLPRWVAEAHVTSCPERDPNRVLGNFEGVSLMSAAHDFDVIPVEIPLECGAGTLQYSLRVIRGDVVGAPVQASWRVRPVYRFAATLALGFDTGQEDRTYTIKDGKIAYGENETTVGTDTKIGFTWFPAGVDYEDMRWYNYLINPVLLFDLDTPKKAFVIGNSFTPTGGISLTVGGSFREVPVLKSGAIGDPTTATTVETTDDWTGAGRGWFFAVSLDSKIYAALKGLLPKGTKE